jgi:hypothetical protein
MVTDRFIEALDKAGNEVAPPRDDQPVAWSFELARAVGPNGYCNFAPPILSFNFPRVPDGAVRNIIPLYTYPLADQAELARLKSELLQRDMTWLPAKDVEIATLKNRSVRLEVAIKSALRQLADGNSVLATDTLARALPTTTQERADG